MTVLVGAEVWDRIADLNRRRKGAAVVFTAYFGTGGAELLPLRPGDQLIVAASELNVSGGNVNPSELMNYAPGVLIYSSPFLHGKGYFFERVAILSSANVSTHSQLHLIEFAVEIPSTKALVTSILDRVPRQLLSASELKRLAAIYRPPIRPSAPTAPSEDQVTETWTKAVSSARVWYHGTFDPGWLEDETFEVDLPSLRRVRPGDWYIMVVMKAGVRYAATPRLVRSVRARRNKVRIEFDRAMDQGMNLVPAQKLEALTVPGAPPIRMRWQLLSDRVPSDQIFAAFGPSGPRREQTLLDLSNGAA